jgi:hypothetical protein
MRKRMRSSGCRSKADDITLVGRAAHLVDGVLLTDCIGSMATPNRRSESGVGYSSYRRYRGGAACHGSEL